LLNPFEFSSDEVIDELLGFRATILIVFYWPEASDRETHAARDKVIQ
jgi:hypothetical protein